ncbi:MAG: UDP-N-acetylglucosamine 1-carboxyvinyltransferase [Alphaproteobacteria bacterium]
MDKIRIKGGHPIRGIIPVSGSKNAALPLMAASLLVEGRLILEGVPQLADIRSMTVLLQQLGVDITVMSTPTAVDGGVMLLPPYNLCFQPQQPAEMVAPYDMVRKMRASILVLGPLLARYGYAKVSLPGGCAIGTRPIDLHLQGLQEMGATINLQDGYVEALAPQGLKGAKIIFPKISVTATENLMMAASLADGETILGNAAREPEVVDLARCLQGCGVEIHGAGTETITIIGRKTLQGCVHRVIPDRIETGTYAIAAAITGGDVLLPGANFNHLYSFIEFLRRAGVLVEETADGLHVKSTGELKGVDVMTEPYPGFPTDLQAQFMSLMTVAQGASMITETIFENRFMHVPELTRLGADITVHHASALVRGVKKLRGAPVMATDLRASVSLVLAGLVAEGETIVNRVYHLDRGYEALEAKLSACGAEIERVKGEH